MNTKQGSEKYSNKLFQEILCKFLFHELSYRQQE
jgi:hypothetical protein